jgi:hypothetical protein
MVVCVKLESCVSNTVSIQLEPWISIKYLHTQDTSDKVNIIISRCEAMGLYFQSGGTSHFKSIQTYVLFKNLSTSYNQ